MSKALRNAVAYDERTGFKVRGRRLKRDFYTGSWTEDPDPQHPQDFVRAPGPDGISYRQGPPAQHAIHGSCTLGADTLDVATMQVMPWPSLSFNPGTPLVADDGEDA